MEIHWLYFPISTSFWLGEEQFHYVFIQASTIYIYNPAIAYKLQNGCENVMLATSTTHRDVICMYQDMQMPHRSDRNSSIQKKAWKKRTPSTLCIEVMISLSEIQKEGMGWEWDESGAVTSLNLVNAPLFIRASWCKILFRDWYRILFRDIVFRRALLKILCCSKCEPCFLLTLVSERKEKGGGI